MANAQVLEAAKRILAAKEQARLEQVKLEQTKLVESSQPVKEETLTKEFQPPEMICLLGPPGSGKTMTALTILDVPGVEKVVCLDADKKMGRMESTEEHIRTGRLHILNIKSPLLAGSLEERAGKSQHIQSTKRQGGGFYTIAPPDVEPKGYLEIMRHMDEAEKTIASIGAQAWITDSLTRVYEHMHRLISYMTKRGTLEESAWNIALMNGEEFVHAHMALPVRYVIVTMHTRNVYDESSGTKIGTEPEIQGSMRSKVIGYFNEAYFMTPTSTGVYRMATMMNQFEPSRTSKRLNRYEPANLRVIFDKEYRDWWYKNNKPVS